jgi:hypothetical protein
MKGEGGSGKLEGGLAAPKPKAKAGRRKAESKYQNRNVSFLLSVIEFLLMRTEIDELEKSQSL